MTPQQPQDQPDETQYQMVAVKRKWVPEWLFAVCAWPFDLVVHQPLRWILTKPIKAPETFSELFKSARNSLDYHIELCFLADGPEQEEEASKKIKKFIQDNYISKP